TFATIHAYVPSLVIYPMTDIGGGIFSLIVTAIFLKFWKPKNEWHFIKESGIRNQESGVRGQEPDIIGQKSEVRDKPENKREEPPLTVWNMTVAWAPYAVMSVFLLLTGFIRQKEGTGPVYLGPIQTNYMIAIPGLHRESKRDARLLEEGREHLPEKAEFNFAWLTNPGTPVLMAAILSMFMH